jgi:putative peptide zinc metalloprotease protein
VTAVARVLRPLFAAPAVVGAAVILLGLDTFLLLERPVTSAFSSLVGEPGAMALVGVLALLGVLWHEFGHATGCSAGGGRPGPIGVGVYIVWPVLYSDLTDTYRLTRRGRLMADGGGIYFSALWAIAAATAYLATGYTPLLALVVAQHVEMALQALPLLRFDGHYIVSDLIGVPDALSRVRPTLTAMLPGHRASRAVTELKPVARRLLRVYAIVTVPALACVLTVVALNVPSMASTAVGALTRAGPQLGRAFGDHDVPAVVGSLGLIVLALLPICGLLVIALLLVRKLVRVATPTPARLAPQLGEGVLIGIAVLYAFFYLGVGASSGAMGCALLIVCGLSFGLVRRRVFTHDSRDPALRRLRERRGF